MVGIKSHNLQIIIFFILWLIYSPRVVGENYLNWTKENFELFQESTIVSGHYVIIGAYAELRNAERLVRRVRSVGFDPKHFFNNSRKLYYVYIFIDDDINEANRISSKLREVNFIKDAWVFSTNTSEPLTERLMANAGDQNADLITDVPNNKPKPPDQSNLVQSNPTNSAMENTAISIQNETAVKSPEEMSGSSSGVRSGTINDQQTTKPVNTSTQVPGYANSLEEDNAIQSDDNPVETNNHASEPEPSPEKLTYTGRSEAVKKLVVAKKGEMVVLENLLFHKNASVLRKVSSDEMDELTEFMKSNRGVRIKIHGHTNGEFKGEVYLLDENDNRFFKLSGKNNVVKGDEKLLSRERANVIRRYLISKGIVENRIETQGWGDNRMIYPQGHIKSNLNRRVEIEILDNQ